MRAIRPHGPTATQHRLVGAPLFPRSIALFFYSYIFKLGFLDGTEGLIFCVPQTFTAKPSKPHEVVAARDKGALAFAFERIYPE